MSTILSVLKIKTESGNWIGIPGLKGEDGNGIASITFQQDGTLVIVDDEGETKTYTGIKAAVQSVDDLIIISDTQPTSPTNKIWIDSDSTSVQVPTMDDFYATLISKSASGPIVTFQDAANGLRLKSLIANLDYKAGGYTSILGTKQRKNFVPNVLPAGTIKGTIKDNGYIDTASNARVFSVRIKPNTNYYASLVTKIGFTLGMSNSIARVGDTVTRIASFTGRFYYSFNSGDNTYLHINPASTAYITNNASTYKFQVEVGNERTEFEVGAVQEDFGADFTGLTGTIYGGTINFITGVLTSTLDENGDPLATPVEYQLSPQVITALASSNLLFADSGDLAVEYYADTKKYIDELLGT